jgi:hypothetical protein
MGSAVSTGATVSIGCVVLVGVTASTGWEVSVGAVVVPQATRNISAKNMNMRHCIQTGLILNSIPTSTAMNFYFPS